VGHGHGHWALAHTLVDRAGWPPLGRRFGINAITAYAGSMLMVCLMNGVGIGGRTLHSWLAESGLGCITPLAGPQSASHAYASLQVLFWWGVLRWMDARHIRVSI
jgi:predicted acyltransferase